MDTDRPRLVYDDDCGFCTWWTDWAVRNGEFDPVGFSALTEEDRDRLPEDYEECVHLITDEEVYSCGAATEEVLARTGTIPLDILGFLNGFSDYERFREDAYRLVADRRDLLGKVVSAEPPVTRRD
ncbi:MAG TPA: DCC1-like thiol-disulfide oxidoreductase family protein [Halococcus sp.]|nr:DCC1-like thiol-disulfide oxidoreductase family protein [Halococcus sp.]